MRVENTSAKIRRLYHDEKMSGPEIAKALGCSKSFVYNRLRSDSRGVRSAFEVGMLQTIKSMYGYIPSRYRN